MACVRRRNDRLGKNQRKQSNHRCNECFVADRAGIFTRHRSLQDTLRRDLFLSLVWTTLVRGDTALGLVHFSPRSTEPAARSSREKLKPRLIKIYDKMGKRFKPILIESKAIHKWAATRLEITSPPIHLLLRGHAGSPVRYVSAFSSKRVRYSPLKNRTPQTC